MTPAKMLRNTFLLLAALACLAVSSAAEEFVLKDGTKILGKMVAIKGDSIEVQTQYGKIKLKRGDILNIGFPENQPEPAVAPDESPAPEQVPPVEHSLDGMFYTNHTGSFTLTFPSGWKINEEQRASMGAMAALNSPDEHFAVAVSREVFPGSLQAYKESVEIMWKNNFGDSYEKLNESETAVNARPGLLILLRAVLQDESGRLPVKFLTLIIQEGNLVTRVAAWCLEPLFKDNQKMLEEILFSYRTNSSPCRTNNRLERQLGKIQEDELAGRFVSGNF